MAVDTRKKRFSLLGFGQARGAPLVLPDPDGSDFNTEAERLQLIYLYAGLSVSGEVLTFTQSHFFHRRRSFGS